MNDIYSNDPTPPMTGKQQQELAASLDSAGSAVPLRPSDLHTRTMVPRIREQIAKWEPQGPAAAGIPKTHGPLEKIDVIPGILAVPTLDEDGDKIQFAKKILFKVLRSLPLTDDAAPWPSRESASAVINSQFAPILPTPAVQWTDVTSDRAMSLLAFQGLAAHRLAPLDTDPGGAAYAVDLSWMCGFAVRPGLEPYGACAYFAADRTLLRVYTSHDDITHRPTDVSWEGAKWRWRSALFTAVTVADHLGATHFLASNLMVTATQEQLPENHPLRRFLKPYGHGAVDLNLDAGLMLSPEGGLAHRLFSFTYGGLSRCLLRGIETMTFQTFPQAMAAKRIEGLGDAYPYATDGLALYDILQTYTKDYLGIFFPAESVVEDPAVRAWWQGIVSLAPTLGLAPLNRAQQLIDLITQVMFTVTGFHYQVGRVSPYLLDPAFLTCKIRAGSQISDIQATVHLIAMIANGLGPARLARSVRKGARLDALRGGPLDKRGTGSRVLQPTGRIDENELARLDQFATDKVDSSGVAERGLGIEQLRTMMDANFARAAGNRRRIDRALMNGEWPILLRVMGKISVDGRYLSLTELRTLFVEQRLPARITQRLTQAAR